VNGLKGLVLAEEVTFHAPTIAEFFPEAVLFVGTPFEMNRIMIIRMIMVILLVVVFWLGTRKMKLVPGRFQGLIEIALDLVRVNIAEDLLGKKDGRRFLPILTKIFLLVLFLIITGIVQGFYIAG
jgi:F-type H+-transporting ATPase subunit a